MTTTSQTIIARSSKDSSTRRVSCVTSTADTTRLVLIQPEKEGATSIHVLQVRDVRVNNNSKVTQLASSESWE